MKYLIMLILLSLASNAFAESKTESQPICLDTRAVLVAPCEGEKNRYFYQGDCKEAYEAEHTYCALEEMTQLSEVKGEVEVPSGSDFALLHGSGQLIRLQDVEVHQCLNATVLLGKPKAVVDSYDPSMGEVGISSIILNFTCADKKE